MSTKTLNLTPALREYLLAHTVHEHPVLCELRLATQQMRQFEMQISPEQGQFMRLLIELIAAKKTLEIGTFTGYSALAVALALPADGEVIACDINPEWAAMAQTYWEKADVADKIKMRLAPALDTCHELIQQNQTGTFDFVFIDADKNNYLFYYEAALTLLRPGGLIAVDNVLWDGEVANPGNQEKSTLSIRELNDLIYRDERVTMSMIPIGDGLTLARKK
jgi:predicted O-methyltransferase YrrM